METNLTIEQAIVEKSKINTQGENQSLDIQRKKALDRSKIQRNYTEFENGTMMTTSEILDFSSGIDSTEYDQPGS